MEVAMKNTKIMVLSIAFFLSLLLKNGLTQEASPARLESDQLKQTAITSYLQDNIAEGKNLIYCSTFQIAWDILSDEIIGAPLQLTGSPLTAQMLNQRLAGRKDISEDCYIAMAGFNKEGIVEKIKLALKEKFNETPGIDISLSRPDDILAYSFLLKDLKFKNEFESLDRPIIFAGSIAVKAFGVNKYAFDENHRKLGEQVNILDYNNDDDFILSLKSISSKDEIILAKVTPKKTMLETINSVFARTNTGKLSGLYEKETLRIPKLDFDILHSYSELAGKHALNKGFEDYFISKAIQAIRFKLNEKGALLKSEAAIVMARSGLQENKLRNFIFDKPFLVCLKEKGAKYPYFAVWVDNTELLLRK